VRSARYFWIDSVSGSVRRLPRILLAPSARAVSGVLLGGRLRVSGRLLPSADP
jgi:hypothetical protein